MIGHGMAPAPVAIVFGLIFAAGGAFLLALSFLPGERGDDIRSRLRYRGGRPVSRAGYFFYGVVWLAGGLAVVALTVHGVLHAGSAPTSPAARRADGLSPEAE
jgi:hypothetical protein